MKAHLLYRDSDFNPGRALPPRAEELVQDLELDILFDAMAGKDAFFRDVARNAILSAPGSNASTALYRQDVLRDCLTYVETVRAIYALSVEALEKERRNFFGVLGMYPASILSRSVDVLKMFAEMLRRLRDLAATEGGAFRSEGFRTFFDMLERELDDAYFEEIGRHLQELRFGAGVLISARLRTGGRAGDYVLREPQETDRGWFQWIFAERPESYSFRIAPRDEQGARALAELHDRGINLVANALAQSNDHIKCFFQQIKAELAFYLGCVNLHTALTAAGAPTAFPEPAPEGETGFSCRGLGDAALTLRLQRAAVGNDVVATGTRLVIVTGANRGGKSTFLRSLGQAQLMLQAGMFVSAEAFRSGLCDGLFTHFKREEDAGMKSGKFDEELVRMSGIVDVLTAHPMVLFNESFAATNEREGSEVASQIVSALLEHGVRVAFVTHLYDFAHRLHERAADDLLFLRADRNEDGSRSFRLREGAPQSTSYGADLYRKVFGAEAPAAPHGDGPGRPPRIW